MMHHAVLFKSIESTFDHTNFNLVSLAIKFERWLVGRARKIVENGWFEASKMAAVNAFEMVQVREMAAVNVLKMVLWDVNKSC